MNCLNNTKRKLENDKKNERWNTWRAQKKEIIEGQNNMKKLMMSFVKFGPFSRADFSGSFHEK